MSTQTTPSRQLAEWCASLSWDHIPADARNSLALRLLDTTGLIIVGAQTEAVGVALDFVGSNEGHAQSTVCGYSSRVSASSAALVHGVAAHCRDYDDTFMDSVVHPGSVVIPTALALSEATNATDEAFATAIIAGYEIAARIGAVAGRRLHARNLHPTGIVGPIAAAATAARLLDLTAEQTSWAMGLAASMSGGLRAFAVDGGWSKWLHVGWAAHGGIVAAQMAGRGFRGPEHVLEGGYDLYSALLHGETIDRTGLIAGLGTLWKGNEAQFKYYPCAHVIQPYIDAYLAIADEFDLQSTDIAEIVCTIAPWAAAIVCEPRADKLCPDTELAAIGSLPYQIAVAAADRRVGLAALESAMRDRNDVRELAARVVHRTDETLGQAFDGEICVRTADGARHVRKAVAGAVDPDKVRQKFIDNTGPILGTEQAIAAAASSGEDAGLSWRWAVDLFSKVDRGEGR
jgi:2-methylcitrate dehydratase PrpD